MSGYTIDDVTYAKLGLLPSGAGYDARPNGQGPESITIHTTNGRPGSSFAAEARYLQTSRQVSAHFLVGDQRTIAQILDPRWWRAWHMGNCLYPWRNAVSIGIECHYTPGGRPWTLQMWGGLTWLVRLLMQRYGISPARVTTHRAAALPAGRKIDPSGVTDAQFQLWRDNLVPVKPANPRFAALAGGTNVRTGPGLVFPVVFQLARGEQFGADGKNGEWWHREDGRGFVHQSVVRKVA